MDVPTAIVILVIVVAPIGLMVFLELRDRRSRHHRPPADGGENDDSLREASRAEQESAASRGNAAGMAYGSGIDGNFP